MAVRKHPSGPHLEKKISLIYRKVNTLFYFLTPWRRCRRTGSFEIIDSLITGSPLMSSTSGCSMTSLTHTSSRTARISAMLFLMCIVKVFTSFLCLLALEKQEQCPQCQVSAIVTCRWMTPPLLCWRMRSLDVQVNALLSSPLFSSSEDHGHRRPY